MIHLQLISLSGMQFDDHVYEVLVPTTEGQIGVMPGHMPLISVAAPGVIAVRRQERDIDEAMEHFAVSGGVVEVDGDRLRVLVDEADHADTIYADEARAAYERAVQMKAEAKDEISLEQAQELIDRSAVRLRVAGLKRPRRG